MESCTRKNILQRLAEGPVIGDGGYVWILEKRGYTLASSYTPEVVLEYPDAARELHREFILAGSDVLQTLTYLPGAYRLNGTYDIYDLNKRACEIARDVGRSSNAMIAGAISYTDSYLKGKGKDIVQEEFKIQCDMFVENDVDFVIAEFIKYVEEMEWAIEALKETGKPIAATMNIGPTGDGSGVSVGDCAVRMAKAGAHIVGLNCLYDYTTCLKTMRIMKEALDSAGLKPFLMLQPLGFHAPDVEEYKGGYTSLPEYPFALEPRVYTRWDARKFAREAYDMGVRYIGGCCGFEPYHIREIAEELSEERGKRPPCADKNSPWGEVMKNHIRPYARKRAGKDYWSNLKPSFGRPDCPLVGSPDETV